jgi:uncharacterized protein
VTDEWQAITDGADVGEAVARLFELIAVGRGESALDTPAVNALDATAPADLTPPSCASTRPARGAGASSRPTAIKLGRNDPCRCGSGKKFECCCGWPARRGD